MSQHTGGHRYSDKQVQEESHECMQNQFLDRVDNHVFLSSKSDSIVNAKSSPSSDDDLVTWLQYPLDDCPDIFQHWPPAPLAPATGGVLAPSPIADSKDLSQQETDAFMMSVASERSLQVNDGRNTITENVLLKHGSHQDRANIDLKGSEGGAHQDTLRFMHVDESVSADPIRQTGPHLHERQKFPTDCRNLNQRELYLQEESKFWGASEAILSTNSGPQLKNRVVEKKTDEMQKMTPVHFKLFPQLQTEMRSFPHRAHKENAQANPAADAALALGAGRAVGAIRASGMEAFSKVRTSSQSVRPFKLGSPPSALIPPSSSGKGVSDGPSSPNMLPPRARPVGFCAVTPFNQQNFPLKQQIPSQPYFIMPSTKVPEAQEHQLMVPMKGVGNSNESSSKESPGESSMIASLGSQGTKYTKEGANVCSTSRAAAFQNVDAPDIQKLSGTLSPCPEKRDDVAFSGDSETSESLKETFSGSKRKLEPESECQSELQDAEGESAVNSQIRNTSSKRTRANEVHNLSERRRRNRINDKMNALRELIPNASKTNKAALLDEAIDYLKNLQLQLQVMSVRTGMSPSPMVIPPGLPHMQPPQIGPLYPMGMGTLGGSSTGVMSAGSTMGVAMCNMTYGVPARPLCGSMNSDPKMLQPPEKSTFAQLQPLTIPESVPLHYPHSFVQSPSQSIFSVSMDMCNNYLQQQQQQQLQQHLHQHEQQASPRVKTPSPPSPSSQQQAHYQL